jgi:hypothetical protein
MYENLLSSKGWNINSLHYILVYVDLIAWYIFRVLMDKH